MLTAAVRDLHRAYPGQFLTDVQTLCPALWENNPHLTRLNAAESDVEVLDCQYPLINRCDTAPHHCLEGFVEFLNQRLGLKIQLSAFKGDVHLSAQEKAWYSQIHELAGEETPFWIVTSGGKYDVTVKWWSPERYQKVVDCFRKRILFVQVGQKGHHHPKLDGVVDLRGQTNLRQLVRLTYHADGVLSPVTCLMHLAAAVEWKRNPENPRPCVVIAGGREPVHWEQYPGHQFIHRVGALPCCAKSGCWRDRVRPLGDGDPRDEKSRLCVDVANGLPRCLDLITADEVIHRIETYYEGGALGYLSRDKWRSARRAIRASRDNPFERLPLTQANARIACEEFIRSIPDYPGRFSGRGLVICGGGCRYFTNAWVNIHLLRQFDCNLPIQLWYLGTKEMDTTMIGLLAGLGVECIDARARQKEFPCRILGGWELKCYALLHCSFEEILLLDADNTPLANPDYLFGADEYQQTGAVFWPDMGRTEKAKFVWDLLGLERPAHPEFESGQIVVNKQICWKALCLSMWINENSDFFYRYLHGDKETFHLAFRKLGQPFALVPTPVQTLPGTMCQHDLKGQRLFQHRNTDKWNLFANNPRVEGFWFEEDCRRYLRELQQCWSGKIGESSESSRLRASVSRSRPTMIAAVVSSSGQERIRGQTLASLAQSDWGDERLLMGRGCGNAADPQERRQRATFELLRCFLDEPDDYLLWLEDDLELNRYLRHNLERWRPLCSRAVTLAGLYNPGILEESCDVKNRAYIIRPNRVFTGKAFLISREASQHLVAHWNEAGGTPDARMSRLVGGLKRPIFYHSPSLAQRIPAAAGEDAALYPATDFDAFWKA